MDHNNQTSHPATPLPQNRPSVPAAQQNPAQPATPQALPYTPAAAVAPQPQPGYAPSSFPAAQPPAPPAAQPTQPAVQGSPLAAQPPPYGAAAPAQPQPGQAGYPYGQAQPGAYTMPTPAKKPASAKIAAIILAVLLAGSAVGNILLAPKATFADDRVYVINDTRLFHNAGCSEIEKDDILIAIPHSELKDFPTLLPCPDCHSFD